MPDEAAHASRRQVAAHDWTPAQLQCRTMQHRWQPSTVQHSRKYRYYYIETSCDRCGTTKHQEMSERGTPYATWYSYIDGYLLEGMGRLAGDARDELRVQLVKRSSVVEVKDAPRSMAAKLGSNAPATVTALESKRRRSA